MDPRKFPKLLAPPPPPLTPPTVRHSKNSTASCSSTPPQPPSPDQRSFQHNRRLKDTATLSPASSVILRIPHPRKESFSGPLPHVPPNPRNPKSRVRSHARPWIPLLLLREHCTAPEATTLDQHPLLPAGASTGPPTIKLFATLFSPLANWSTLLVTSRAVAPFPNLQNRAKFPLIVDGALFFLLSCESCRQTHLPHPFPRWARVMFSFVLPTSQCGSIPPFQAAAAVFIVLSLQKQFWRAFLPIITIWARHVNFSFSNHEDPAHRPPT